MIKLSITPNKIRYSEKSGSYNKVANVDGGFPRVRRDKVTSESEVTVQWALNPLQYRYMSAFYRKATNYGSKQFLVDLHIGDSDISEFVAVIKENSWKLSSQVGHKFVISATLLVTPNEPDENYDINLINPPTTPPNEINFISTPISALKVSAFRHLKIFDLSDLGLPNITSTEQEAESAPSLMGIIS